MQPGSVDVFLARPFYTTKDLLQTSVNVAYSCICLLKLSIQQKMNQNSVNESCLIYLLTATFYTAKNLKQNNVNGDYLMYLLAETFYTAKN